MDSIISLGQKNTLVEYMILFDADNRPPMLDKDLYDSWKSQMELYMQNREHGRMILESIENGPLIWPTVEDNGVIRTKKYAELSAAEKIQVDCDMKATNIILQGLHADIYSLMNHHRVAKDLWERVQLLMQGLLDKGRKENGYTANKFQGRQGHNIWTIWLQALAKANQECCMYKKEAMLSRSSEARKIYDKEQLAFLIDLGIPADQAQTIIPHNAAFQTEDLDTNHEKMIDSQMDDMIREKLALKEQVDLLEQNLSKQIKEKESVLQTFLVFKNESKEKENKYMENEMILEKKIRNME
ncbi:hypothetical protein Tco_1172988 [Tanacetum coccineum]